MSDSGDKLAARLRDADVAYGPVPSAPTDFGLSARTCAAERSGRRRRRTASAVLVTALVAISAVVIHLSGTRTPGSTADPAVASTIQTPVSLPAIPTPSDAAAFARDLAFGRQVAAVPLSSRPRRAASSNRPGTEPGHGLALDLSLQMAAAITVAQGERVLATDGLTDRAQSTFRRAVELYPSTSAAQAARTHLGDS